MNFSLKKITNYCENHTTKVDKLREELDRETHLKTLAPQMLAGHYQGKLLEFFSNMIRPKYILEIGTFTGYSALCWARGIKERGKIITIESNYELEHLIKNYFEKSDFESIIDLRIGNALEIIPTLEFEFDIVYIDAGKTDYPNYFDLVIDKVATHGFIIADNVLWDGKVTMAQKDEETAALDEFNKKVHKDPRVENIILPVRDGLNIMRKL